MTVAKLKRAKGSQRTHTCPNQTCSRCSAYCKPVLTPSTVQTGWKRGQCSQLSSVFILCILTVVTKYGNKGFQEWDRQTHGHADTQRYIVTDKHKGTHTWVGRTIARASETKEWRKHSQDLGCANLGAWSRSLWCWTTDCFVYFNLLQIIFI